MIIETNPCANCDLCPSFCGVDIEMCQMACEPLPNIEKRDQIEDMKKMACDLGEGGRE